MAILVKYTKLKMFHPFQAIKAEETFFLVFAVQVKFGEYRLYVYEFNFSQFKLHHTIDCKGTILATITLGYNSDHMFLIVTNYKDVYRSSYESYVDVYHWRARHFDPVSTRQKNPIKTTGVFDVVAWDYYGELRFAILQYTFTKFGHATGNTEIVVLSITTEVHRGKVL